MSGGSYVSERPVDCSVAPDRSQCRGKSVIVTGGSSSLRCPYEVLNSRETSLPIPELSTRLRLDLLNETNQQ